MDISNNEVIEKIPPVDPVPEANKILSEDSSLNIDHVEKTDDNVMEPSIDGMIDNFLRKVGPESKESSIIPDDFDFSSQPLPQQLPEFNNSHESIGDLKNSHETGKKNIKQKSPGEVIRRGTRKRKENTKYKDFMK